MGRAPRHARRAVVSREPDDPARRGGRGPNFRVEMGQPYHAESAPHVPALLDAYRHCPGERDPGPVAVGEGTQGGLRPHGVNVGPSTPDAAYTGDSDHEFVTVEQRRPKLLMQAAMLVGRSGDRAAPP